MSPLRKISLVRFYRVINVEVEREERRVLEYNKTRKQSLKILHCSSTTLRKVTPNRGLPKSIRKF